MTISDLRSRSGEPHAAGRPWERVFSKPICICNVSYGGLKTLRANISPPNGHSRELFRRYTMST